MARAARDGRVAGGGVDDVVARAAYDRILPRAARDGRVAGDGVDDVVVVVERDVGALGRADELVKFAVEGHLIVVGVDDLHLT